MDWFGCSVHDPDRHGPVVMREFTQEGVAPLVVDTTHWDDVNRVAVTGAGSTRIVAQVNPADPGTCPTSFDPQQDYWSGYVESGISMYPPASSFCVSTFYYDPSVWRDVISRPVMQQVTLSE
jgi:hypothetical protein